MVKKINGIVLFIFIFSILTLTDQANSSGKISIQEIYIPYEDFTTSDVQMDGKTDEGNFFNFTISLDSGDVLNIYWRHNADNLHAVLKSEINAWLALGWHNDTPSSTSGAGVMNKANILIGSNAGQRDDTGVTGNHNADTTQDNYVAKFGNFDGTYTTFEFLFPLSSSDPVDNPLTIGKYGYFIFAVGSSPDIELIHSGGSTGAEYVPNVYIETNSKEGYVAPASAPFADLNTILLALTIPSIIVFRKRNNIKNK